MKRLTLAFVLVASTASATPILTASGSWLPLPAACECGNAKWSGYSADGRDRNLGFALERLGLSDGLEYMASGGFTLTEWSGTHIYGETAWTSATLTEAGGVLTYDDKHGPIFTSNAPSGGAGYFALFRKALGDSVYRIYVAVNDTWPGDADGQDYIAVMDGVRMPTICSAGCGQPPGVPETPSLVLFGLAAIGAGRRFRR